MRRAASVIPSPSSLPAALPCLLLGLLSLAPLGCSKRPASPEAQVRQTIAAVEKAVDEKDVDGVMEHVSAQYSDQEGQKRSGVRSMLALRFLRQGSIHSLVRIREVRVQGARATAELAIAIAGTPLPEDGILEGLRADTFTMTIAFEKEDDAWKVRRAEWDRGGMDLFE